MFHNCAIALYSLLSRTLFTILFLVFPQLVSYVILLLHLFSGKRLVLQDLGMVFSLFVRRQRRNEVRGGTSVLDVPDNHLWFSVVLLEGRRLHRDSCCQFSPRQRLRFSDGIRLSFFLRLCLSLNAVRYYPCPPHHGARLKLNFQELSCCCSKPCTRSSFRTWPNHLAALTNVAPLSV